MSSFLHKALPYLGAAGGIYLGSQMFPETFGSISGGLVGSSAAAGPTTKGFFDGINPTIASAGIFAATTLFSGLFGQNLDETKMDDARRQFEEDLAFRKEQAAQNKELALAQIAASGRSSNAAAGAAKRQADVQLAGQRATAVGNAADRKAAALKDLPGVIAAGRAGQANQAQATGASGQQAFRNYISAIQAPLIGG